MCYFLYPISNKKHVRITSSSAMTTWSNLSTDLTVYTYNAACSPFKLTPHILNMHVSMKGSTRLSFSYQNRGPDAKQTVVTARSVVSY